MFESVDRGNAFLAHPWRRTARARFRTLVCAVVLAATSPAFADVGPPVKVRLSAETTKPATSGADYSTVIEVVAGADGTIDSFTLSGDGWENLSHDITTPRAVHAGEVIPIRFNGRPADSDKPLHVSMVFNGRTTTKAFRFSAARFEEGSQDGRATRIDGQDPAAAAAAALRLPKRAFTDRRRPNPSGGGDGPTPHGSPVHLRFFGRIVYQRDGGPIVGADTMWFQIMDDDDISTEPIVSGFTDPDGYFDIEVDWDDCDIAGCDDPDIFIRWETDNQVVNVERADLLEEDYSWSTIDSQIYEDFTGSIINFGSLMPANMAQHPAMHISNSIVRAHRYILNVDGTWVQELDVQWPEDEQGSGAWYTASGSHEIFICPSQQWGEVVHVHEYGHHFMTFYSVNTTPNYCNGICDANGCGHCIWCPENATDAWNEGWPNWLGSIVMRNWQAQYGIAPWSAATNPLGLMNVEQLVGCGSAPTSPTMTEGYATALLFDMDDGNVNNDPNGDGVPDWSNEDADGGAPDCDMDAMSARDSNIFLVVREDDPATIQQFIDAYWARFPLDRQDFWSTVRNISPTYALPPIPQPILTSQPILTCQTLRTGESLQLTVTGNGALLKYQWRRGGMDLTDGTPISGALTPTLSINPVDASHGGMYDCVVTTCDGTQSVTSAAFRVHVFGALGGGQRVSGFGRNNGGQLGNGELDNPDWPQPRIREVVNLSDVVQVSGGQSHSVALKSDGTVWAWGVNNYGQLGQGNVNPYPPQAIQVPGLTDMVAVSAGGSHSMALKSNGTVWVWGANYSWQLGNAPPDVNSGGWSVPVMIPINELSCVIAVAAGYTTSFALKADGTVVGWGWEYHGELGNDPLVSHTRNPVPVANLTEIVEIDAGWHHFLALRFDGSVWSCGRNIEGQLGDGSFVDRYEPVQVQGIGGVNRVRSGPFHSLALRNNDTAWGWGSNGGKLGDGTADTRPLPVQALVSPVIDLGGGYYSSIFLKPDGTAWTCGTNYNGDLGTGPTPPLLTPTRVTALQFPCTRVTSGDEWNMVHHAPTPPFIARPPASGTTLSGAILKLTPDAYGSLPLQFQWYFNGNPVNDGILIQGATTMTLTIDPVLASHAGDYFLRVTNPQGTVDTAVASIAVLPAPFCDEFNAGPSNLWGNELGAWTVTNGAYGSTLGGAYSSLPFVLDDYTLQTDIMSGNIGGVWVRTPVTPSGTGLLLYNSGGSLAWYTYNSGSYSQPINSVSDVYAAGTSFSLRVEASGQTFSAFVNNGPAPVTQYTTAAYPSARVALLGGSTQAYDSVCISTPGAPAPPGGNLNGDGAADGLDIPAFAAAVLAGANDPGVLANADFNGNGVMDPGDVPGFVQVMVGP